MKSNNTFSRFSFTLVFACALQLFGGFAANAQCPLASSCTPGNPPNANLTFGMGIYHVSFGNINNATAGVTDGYQDYSCTIGANLIAGIAHPIQINTNPNVGENVKIWIDYNNDGTFDPIAEL